MLNPEFHWDRGPANTGLDPTDVYSRIGEVSEPMALLSGGLANTNIRIGKNKVLRIYRRDASALLKERALLLKPWQFISVPEILAAGHDYLLMSYVEHQPLMGSAEEGEAVACALSEIHGHSYDSSGFLGSDLALTERWSNAVESLGSYMTGCFAKLDFKIYGDLGLAASRRYSENSARMAEISGGPVLLHADFKLSNLHAVAEGPPLVLDWEFAYAGSRLADIGQLMRWDPPKAFIQGFEAAYQGMELGPDWRRLARIIDLPNLAGLLVNTQAGSIRDRDITVLMKEILS